MGGLSPWHLLIIVAVLLLFFARPGKLSGLMGDAAKGVKAFKDGLKDGDAVKNDPSNANAPLPRTEAEKEDLKR
jgi:sec-independent protein translocase protein TatA